MQNIKELILKTANYLKSNEKLALPVLAARARKAAQQDPTDSAVVLASQALTKMASNNTFITKSEFNTICDKFYANGTKLHELFKDELDRPGVAAPKYIENAGEFDYSKEMLKIADPVLSNALKGAFEGKHSIYSDEDAKRAHKSCQAGLLAVGMEPKRVSTFAGQEDIILCNAEYETPKGSCHVLVPIEVKAGKALLPNMFLGEFGFVDLTKSALVNHVKSTAGKGYKVDGQGLLNVLSTSKNGIKKIASDVEMAAIRVRAEKSKVAHDTNGIIGLKLIEASVVEAPQYLESEKFADKLNKPDDVAKLIHGNGLVEAGRNIVARKMKEFGFGHAQVRVGAVDEKEIVFAVGIGTDAGLKVPVKISNKKVIEPNIVIANGSVKKFAAKELLEILKSGGDKRALAVASPNFGMSPESLLKQAKESIDEGNYTRAEDIINVLSETDKHAFNVAVAYMMESLNPAPNKDRLEKAASNMDRLPVSFNTYNIYYPKES